MLVGYAIRWKVKSPLSHPYGSGAKWGRMLDCHAMFAGVHELSDYELECKIVPTPLYRDFCLNELETC